MNTDGRNPTGSSLQRLTGNFMVHVLACFQRNGDVNAALAESYRLFAQWKLAYQRLQRPTSEFHTCPGGRGRRFSCPHLNRSFHSADEGFDPSNVEDVPAGRSISGCQKEKQLEDGVFDTAVESLDSLPELLLRMATCFVREAKSSCSSSPSYPPVHALDASQHGDDYRNGVPVKALERTPSRSTPLPRNLSTVLQKQNYATCRSSPRSSLNMSDRPRRFSLPREEDDANGDDDSGNVLLTCNNYCFSRTAIRKVQSALQDLINFSRIKHDSLPQERSSPVELDNEIGEDLHEVWDGTGCKHLDLCKESNAHATASEYLLMADTECAGDSANLREVVKPETSYNSMRSRSHAMVSFCPEDRCNVTSTSKSADYLIFQCPHPPKADFPSDLTSCCPLQAPATPFSSSFPTRRSLSLADNHSRKENSFTAHRWHPCRPPSSSAASSMNLDDISSVESYCTNQSNHPKRRRRNPKQLVNGVVSTGEGKMFAPNVSRTRVPATRLTPVDRHLPLTDYEDHVSAERFAGALHDGPHQFISSARKTVLQRDSPDSFLDIDDDRYCRLPQKSPPRNGWVQRQKKRSRMEPGCCKSSPQSSTNNMQIVPWDSGLPSVKSSRYWADREESVFIAAYNRWCTTRTGPGIHWDKVIQEMEGHGVYRSRQQCRDKIKHLLLSSVAVRTNEGKLVVVVEPKHRLRSNQLERRD